MLVDSVLLLLAASLSSGASIPRQDADTLDARQDTGDPGLQNIPTTAKPDNTFSNGAAAVAGWKSSTDTPPAVYGNRTIDLPFGRLYVCDFGSDDFYCIRVIVLRQVKRVFRSVDIFQNSISNSG